MDWLTSIVRIAGASFPVASSLVQLQSEIDSKTLLKRVSKLEDPISHLHEDVSEVSRLIYQKLKHVNKIQLQFDEPFYRRFSRALAVLESQGFIEGRHGLGKQYMEGVSVVDPSYIMYLCAIAEDEKKMVSLLKQVDDCHVGQNLDGKEMNIDLPLPVIMAVFKIYESKGFGRCSKEINSCRYVGMA